VYFFFKEPVPEDGLRTTGLQIARGPETRRRPSLNRFLFSVLFGKACMIRANPSADIAGKNPAAAIGVGIRTLST